MESTMKKIIAGVALIGTAVSAQAADLAVKAPYTKAPPMVSVYDWTGFYLGVNAGLGLGRDRTQHFDAGGADSLYLSPLGAVGGGQIGYNWQTNSFLGPICVTAMSMPSAIPTARSWTGSEPSVAASVW